MTFPIGLWDLTIWLAGMAIILIITSELFSPYYGRVNIRIDKRRLRNAALIVSLLFLATVAVRIIGTFLIP